MKSAGRRKKDGEVIGKLENVTERYCDVKRRHKQKSEGERCRYIIQGTHPSIHLGGNASLLPFVLSKHSSVLFLFFLFLLHLKCKQFDVNSIFEKKNYFFFFKNWQNKRNRFLLNKDDVKTLLCLGFIKSLMEPAHGEERTSK